MLEDLGDYCNYLCCSVLDSVSVSLLSSTALRVEGALMINEFWCHCEGGWTPGTCFGHSRRISEAREAEAQNFISPTGDTGDQTSRNGSNCDRS